MENTSSLFSFEIGRCSLAQLKTMETRSKTDPEMVFMEKLHPKSQTSNMETRAQDLLRSKWRIRRQQALRTDEAVAEGRLGCRAEEEEGASAGPSTEKWRLLSRLGCIVANGGLVGANWLLASGNHRQIVLHHAIASVSPNTHQRANTTHTLKSYWSSYLTVLISS